MSIFTRVSLSLSREGFQATSVKLYGLCVDYWFDFRHGTETCSWSELDKLTIRSENRGAGNRYQPARVLPVRRLLKNIRTELPPNPVLVDFGSGKSRVQLVAAESGMRDIRGVEFSEELCRIARRNCERFKSRTRTSAVFRVVESDAAIYEVQPEENVFFFYNPFDNTVLSRVLDNITASLVRHRREILMIYCNPLWSDVITSRPEFELIREVHFWGSQFNVIRNRC